MHSSHPPKIAHRHSGDEAALEDQRRLDAEEGGLPQHEVGPLADFDGTRLMADAVRQRGLDGEPGQAT